jgi:hypothetical protein
VLLCSPSRCCCPHVKSARGSALGRILLSLHIKNKAAFNDQEQDELVEVRRDSLASLHRLALDVRLRFSPRFSVPVTAATRCSACGLNQVGVRHAFRRFGYRDLSMRCFSALATLLDACVYIYEQAALMLLSPDARSDPPRPRRCAGPPIRRLQLHASAYPALRSEYAYACDR